MIIFDYLPLIGGSRRGHLKLLRLNQEMASTTPMMRQYLDIKKLHPDKFLFFRLGDFYEMFFEDAIEASRVLEITLTSRNRDKAGNAIPMCGIPFHAIDAYLTKLLKQGYKVAICEQTEDAREATGLVRREVTRVVTPGTTVQEGVLDARENNYVASLLEMEGSVGAAFLDVSTGEFWLSQEEGPGAWPATLGHLTHFGPAELILPEQFADQYLSKMPHEVRSGVVDTRQPDWTFHSDYSRRALLDHFGVTTLECFGVNGEDAAVAAAGGLLGYARETQKTSLAHIVSLRLFDPKRYLRLDATTVSNLELVRGIDGNRKWTLLATLDRTRTGMGARLLRSWVLRPSTERSEIDSRLDAVEELTTSSVARGRLGSLLDQVYDIERLLGRVTLETAHPRDLVALAASFSVLPDLSAALQSFRARLLQPSFDCLEDVRALLEKAIDPDAPVSLLDGGVIRSGFDEGLDELRGIASSGKGFIAALETKERERTGISSLKVKYNRVFGYFIEVTKANLGQVPEDYLRKQTLVNSERFITPELKAHEEEVLGAEEKILELERALFRKVRAQVGAEAVRIQETATALARLDILLSFAEVAQSRRYARPILDDSREMAITAGWHPVLQELTEEPFVPNDLVCNDTSDQLLILTGPNMGGKSTYLRQNALIVILAQMGSFVPAEAARIGLVDQIFTRVGASDNLARGRSTFMVEMIETAHILNTATPRSLVLLDEVGRGTATFDGLSLAWSIAEFLVTEPERRARTLFATHYQELTKLESLYEGVKNYRVTIRQSKGEILFFHRVLPGVASRSYGIEVARLAGIPAPVLERAREILSRLERKQLDVSGRKRSSSTHQVLEELQKQLF